MPSVHAVPSATAPKLAGHAAGCWPHVGDGGETCQWPPPHTAIVVQSPGAPPPYSHPSSAFIEPMHVAPATGAEVGHGPAGDAPPPPPVVEVPLDPPPEQAAN